MYSLFKIMLFVVLFLLTSCLKSFDKKNARKYIQNDSLIIRTVLKGIPPTYHHFLVFPKDFAEVVSDILLNILKRREQKGRWSYWGPMITK